MSGTIPSGTIPSVTISWEYFILTKIFSAVITHILLNIKLKASDFKRGHVAPERQNGTLDLLGLHYLLSSVACLAAYLPCSSEDFIYQCIKLIKEKKNFKSYTLVVEPSTYVCYNFSIRISKMNHNHLITGERN